MKQKSRRLSLGWWLIIALLSIATVYLIEGSDLLATPLKDFSTKKSTMVKRGEFAELLFHVKNLPEPPKERSKKCLPDVPLKSKYQKPICALKEAGFLEGFSKFEEKKLLRMKEFITIMCRVENWVTKGKPSHNACVKAAKKLGLLDVFGKKTPKLTQSLKRKQVTAFFENLTGPQEDILKQVEGSEDAETLTQEQGEERGVAPRAMEDEEVPVVPFTPVNPIMIAKSFFGGVIELENDFPNTFYLHENYHFKGRILSGTFDQIFVFLIPGQNVSAGESTINYLIEVENNGTFDIPVIFRRAGNFQLGIIAGESGKSKVTDISVLEKIPDPIETQQAPAIQKGMTFTYKEGETIFAWENRIGNCVRLTFQQGKRSMSYFSRSFVAKFIPDVMDFKNFQPADAKATLEFSRCESGTTSGAPGAINISSPWIEAASQEILLVERPIRTFRDTIECPKFDEVLQVPGILTIDCMADAAVNPEGLYTEPDGEVKTFILANGSGKKRLPAGTKLQIELTLRKGVNVVEVNDPDGSALINMPVFVGKNLAPLIPDFLGRTQAVLDPSPLTDIEKARKELLVFINEARKIAGRKPVRLDPALNPFTQAHCEDMAKRNFFSHYNPENEGPDDRRKKAGIDTLVKENLAKSPTVEFGHEGLMASPAHRKNILEREWTRVGIGVTKNLEGSFLLCEEFSIDPYTEEDLTRLENEFLNKANEVRASKGLGSFEMHEVLKTKAKEWSQKMATERFFGFKSPTEESLITIVRNSGVRSSIQSHLIEGNDLTQVEKEFLAQPLDEVRFRSVGIGFAKDAIGTLKVTVIYSE